LIGTILNVYKKRICFYFWLVGNISLCVINFYTGSYAQALLWGVYAGISIWGLIQWGKPEAETKEEIPFTKKETRRLPYRKQKTLKQIKNK
jgi:nicotinamide riboside transporter PnuC